MRTLYELLGVAETASVDEIRAAFRKLARELHPDINKDPQAAEAFKIVTAAYDILSDTKKRAWYDAKLAAARQPRMVRFVIQSQWFDGGFGSTSSTANTTTGPFFSNF